MKSALVVLYSLSGQTRRLGAQIAQRLDCPMVELDELRPRRGVIGYLRCGFDTLFARLPQIAPVERNLREYSMVVIGTPVWMGHVSSPVRRFLMRHRDAIGTLAAFCTMGGSDPARVFADIASAGGQPLVATLAVSRHELGSAQHAAQLERFMAALGARREPR